MPPVKARLSPADRRQGSVRVGEPQQAEKSDNDHLANNREAVDQEGTEPASDRRLYQVHQVHNTARSNSSPPSTGALCRGTLLSWQAGAARQHYALPCHPFYSQFAVVPSEIALNCHHGAPRWHVTREGAFRRPNSTFYAAPRSSIQSSDRTWPRVI